MCVCVLGGGGGGGVECSLDIDLGLQSEWVSFSAEQIGNDMMNNLKLSNVVICGRLSRKGL